MYNKLKDYNTEELHFFNHEETGLKVIIAIHSTVLGPATGGTRFWNYESDEQAITDVLRLSRGMSYKNACGGVMRGGAKAVIIGDPTKLKNEAFFRAYGRFIEGLGGKFTTGQDVNITEEDCRFMLMETNHIAGVSGEGRGGDPSPYTARGVFRGIQAGALAKFGDKSLKGKKVAVQGLGKVGYDVCRWLHEDGAQLIVADINKDALARAEKEFGAKIVDPADIIFQDVDVFSPCALGAVVKSEDVPKYQFALIAGAANNVLLNPEAGEAVHKAGILYVPDYVINAGGVISVDLEIQRIHTPELANEKMDGIFNNVKNILDFAIEKDLPTYVAADEYAIKLIADHKAK